MNAGEMGVPSSDETVDLDLVRQIELCAFRAWPALETCELDGWVLRHSVGITRRANSVFANVPREAGDRLSIDAAIAEVAAWYVQRQSPARYQICAATQPADLDAKLAANGYRAVARTGVLVAELDHVIQATHARRAAGHAQPVVELAAMPSPAWWACYAAGDELDTAGVAGRQQIIKGICQPAAYALALVDGDVAGVGSVAVDGKFAGFFNIATRHEYRRQGVARAVIEQLATWCRNEGADSAYLQVMDQNSGARALYRQLGFLPCYHYHYREQA